MTRRHAADRVLARVRAWWTERRARREARLDAMDATDEPLSIWWTEKRLEGVEDTGSIVPTPEDWASIKSGGPWQMPVQRRRHARSEDFGEET